MRRGERAVQSFQESLAIFEDKSDGNDQVLARCYEEALSIVERTLPKLHPDLLMHHMRMA